MNQQILYDLGHQINEILYCNDNNISVFGLHCGQRILLANAICMRGSVHEDDSICTSPKILIYVCDDYFAAGKIFEQLKYINPNVINLPSIDDILVDRHYNNLNSQTRLHALISILQAKDNDLPIIVVATVASCLQPCADSMMFGAASLQVVKGGSFCIEQLCSHMIDYNYSRVASVTEPGQFSSRGDILDIWSAGAEFPVRLDFFGDELESIKTVDPESRLSIQPLDSIFIVPNCEMGSMRFADFVGNCVVVFDDTRTVANAKERVLQEHSNRISSLLSTGQIEKSQVVPMYDNGLEFCGRKIACHGDLSQNRLFQPNRLFEIKSFAIPDYSRDYERLVDDIKMWASRKTTNEIDHIPYKITLCFNTPEQQGILQKLLKTHKLDDIVQLLNGGVMFGAVLGKNIIIGQYELFKKIVKQLKKTKNQLFSQINQGDYVVHRVHGIGLYEKSAKLDFGGTPRDYLVVKYKNGDTLYVPVENMDSLSKYSSQSTPTLNKLGGQEFEKTKQKVKQGVRKMAFDLLALYAQREQARGIKYNIDDRAFVEFEQAFEHSPTECQVAATKDILEDLRKGKVMDRLICGDVGYGKTEVAMRAAYCAILEGKQVAFVCPTTILAHQHANSVQKRLEPFGINIAKFSRFESPKAIKSNIEKLKLGKIDIAVGTHRLLQKDVVFKDLGILILDEEQRFGVADKEKIKRIKTDINVLTLSATPIPRTLHMSLQSIRDISVLDTPPKARLPVQTYVAEYSDNLLKDAIMRELGRGGAAFVVYNKVADMPRFVVHLQQLLPDTNIVMAHGQMSSDIMEDAVSKFVDGQANILVASTIIENGVDMPHANTMIVLDSEMLGLAQMYQLRGRVGRSDRQAYVYFTYDSRHILNDKSTQRLQAITEFTEFGSGFKLAMRDLEIRGAGNILGREQHGHMDKVGYDMYCRLLQETVDELKGQKSVSFKDIKTVTDLPSFIPDDYISDHQSKMDVYARVAIIFDLQQREQLLLELNNIYGKPPVSTTNLLTIGLFKNLAQQLGASAITLKKNQASISFEKVLDIPKSLANQVKQGQILINDSKPTVKFGGLKDMLECLLKIATIAA
ncbi:MAG: transcription-repair coupling factor [Firmicutes bacterium]|nr:transcription-repair coupling factor [Bacillota bacterium]MCL1954167.1 transcription-repair coupling factor [Bacillota bacterium]